MNYEIYIEESSPVRVVDQGKPEEAEIIYRAIDKIRMRNSTWQYRYEDASGKYVSPINYIYTSEDNDYIVECNLKNVYDELVNAKAMEIKGDIVNMLSMVSSMPSYAEDVETMVSLYYSTALNIYEHKYAEAFHDIVNTEVFEKLGQKNLSWYDDVEGYSSAKEAKEVIIKYVLPYLAQNHYVFSKYNYIKVPLLTTILLYLSYVSKTEHTIILVLIWSLSAFITHIKI